jgi:hypothetical protein
MTATWETLPIRFWKKVDKTPGYGPSGNCWRWAASTRGDYGCIGTPEGTQSAHRVSYTINVGPIPDGLDILHSCDMPLCVNPEHLAPGTHQENMAQIHQRKSVRRGPASNRRLSPEQAAEILKDTRSQRDLAKIFGVSQVTICNVKSGKFYPEVSLCPNT